MKHLPIVLFLGHIIFLCSKTFHQPISNQDFFVSGLLLILVVSDKIIRHLHRDRYNKSLLEQKKIDLELKRLELSKPIEEDEEVAKLKRENEIAGLKLRKFSIDQEYSKREITKTVEGQGGLRF